MSSTHQPLCTCPLCQARIEAMKTRITAEIFGRRFPGRVLAATLASDLGFESPVDVADSMIVEATRLRTWRIAELEARLQLARHHFEVLAEQLAAGDTDGAQLLLQEILSPAAAGPSRTSREAEGGNGAAPAARGEDLP